MPINRTSTPIHGATIAAMPASVRGILTGMRIRTAQTPLPSNGISEEAYYKTRVPPFRPVMETLAVMVIVMGLMPLYSNRISEEALFRIPAPIA